MASDRFREFEVFACVIDAGSFSEAARRLGCTPSAVSKLIDRLEGRIGMRLLQRTSRALSLTAEGRTFQQAAVHALEAVTEAESLMLAESAADAELAVMVAAFVAWRCVRPLVVPTVADEMLASTSLWMSLRAIAIAIAAEKEPTKPIATATEAAPPVESIVDMSFAVSAIASTAPPELRTWMPPGRLPEMYACVFWPIRLST